MKIKQYINERPKLKKALKITAVIGVLFSVGLNILVFGSLAVSCSQVKEKDTIEKLSPQPKGLYNGNEWTLYSFNGDLCNKGFLKSLFDYRNEVFGGGDLSDSFPYEDLMDFIYNADNGDYNNFYCRSINDTQGRGIWGFILMASDYSPSTMANYTNNNTAVKYFRLTKGNMAVRSELPGYVFKDYVYTLSAYGINDNVLASFNFNLDLYTDTSGRIVDYTIMNYENYTRYLLTNKVSKQSTGGDVLGNIYGLGDYLYGIGYDKGYENGYNEGFNYEDNQSTAFSVITNAFNAVAGFMNIQILPHLSLGVLLLSPIIVTLIIVIIKMFRG